MDDLISRQAAIDALTEYGNGRAVFISVGEAVIRIEQLPPIQPEIVRCKDCKYLEMTKLHHCIAFNLDGVEAEFFCGFAKRREVTT